MKHAIALCAAMLLVSPVRRRAFRTSMLVVVASGVLPFAPSVRGEGRVHGEDGFADTLVIPEGIEIAEPVPDPADVRNVDAPAGGDPWQDMVRLVLAVPGNDAEAFVPAMPSLREASTDHAEMFRDYIEASPDWHVFMERENHFACRRWSYGGEPRDTLHGYISEFGGETGFQARCLLCLDRKQWGRYRVQHVQEGADPAKPDMRVGNAMFESRVMIECGGAWVEIFEQSGNLERRVTEATVAVLELEFAEFLRNPRDAVAKARARSRALAAHPANDAPQPFRLVTGPQPGIYGVVYHLNPGERGSVYLQAFEATKGAPLSVERLRGMSETRMTWSSDPAERFFAKAGFMIEEGDWGQPYAARFEVWFKPDTGAPDRKLAARTFKIEGWQR